MPPSIPTAPARAQLTPFPRVPEVSWRGLHHPVHSVQTRLAVASLANSASGDAVTVVVTGDSTSLDIGNDALTTFDTMFGMITRKMRADNPGVTFRFINRGVGGTTWGSLNATPSANYPTWYSTPGAAWINSYIAGAGNGGLNKAPDLVIICMGTNDNSSMGFPSPAAVLAKFADTQAALFPKIPDIWLCTSMGRTTDSTYSTADQNYGSILASSTVRQIARCGHAKMATTGAIYPRQIGLLDFGRMWAMTTLGTDPASQSLTNYTTAQLAPYQGMTALATTGLTLPSCDGDFDFTATFPAQGGTLLAGRSMRIAVGAPLVTGTVRSQFILTISGTSFQSQYWPGLGSVSFAGTNVTVAAGADVVIRCTAKQEHLFMSINGTTVWDQVALRGHGPMSPRFYFAVDGVNDLNLNVNLFRAGRGLPYAATMNNAAAWGENPVGVNGATGGNMINHPTSLYIQEVVVPVIDAQSMSFA